NTWEGLRCDDCQLGHDSGKTTSRKTNGGGGFYLQKQWYMPYFSTGLGLEPLGYRKLAPHTYRFVVLVGMARSPTRGGCFFDPVCMDVGMGWSVYKMELDRKKRAALRRNGKQHKTARCVSASETRLLLDVMTLVPSVISPALPFPWREEPSWHLAVGYS
ncbi:hypothetical protein Bbelb_443850, partial [Branchiostoma belcheri]